MKNYKKPGDNKLGEGKGNFNHINVLNPNNETRVLVDKDKEWVNPFNANFEGANKQIVKTIIQ